MHAWPAGQKARPRRYAQHFMTARNNRPEGGQRNDCTVRALATACDVDYYVVLQTLRAAGRRDNAGFHVKKWLEANDDMAFGCLFTRVTNYGGLGVYVAMNQGHIVAWIDGVKYDAEYGLVANMRPKWAWKVQRGAYHWEPAKLVNALLED